MYWQIQSFSHLSGSLLRDLIFAIVFNMSSNRHQLAELIEQGKLPEDKLNEALSILNISPTTQNWQSFIMTLLLWIGGLAIAFASLFFIAFNWDELGRFSKFAMVEVSIALCILLYWKLGTDKPSAKVALFMAIILVGVLIICSCVYFGFFTFFTATF